MSDKKCTDNMPRREFIERSAFGVLGLVVGAQVLGSNDKAQGGTAMERKEEASKDRHAAWYLFVPGIGYSRRWQGRPLAAPPVEDPGKAKLGGFLEDLAQHLLGEMRTAGSLHFRSLWCGGPCERAFLAPKTRAWTKMITEKKSQLENLEQTVHEWAPERYAEVTSEWQRFRPGGHMLVIEARPVHLKGEQDEMQAEANEIFRDAYGDTGPQPRLSEITELATDGPDRWYVIIGSLKLAGLDRFRCGERDGLNSCAEEASLAGTAEAESPDRRRAQVLVKIHLSVAPEISTGAWFDLEDVRRAWARERETGGEWHERFTGVERLGSHLNFLWCNIPIGIKGPYFLPGVKGIVTRLSEGRRTYRQVIAERAKELGVEVRSLMLFFEVRSPWLGQQGSHEPERLRQYFAAATRGISPLCDLYWEDPWGGKAPSARIFRPGQWNVADGYWLR